MVQRSTPLTVDRVLASAPGSASPRGSAVAAGRFARAASSTLAMAPFFLYTLLGLGIPAAAVVIQAFRNSGGHATLSNIHTVVHGTFLQGFENSLELAAISAVVPGILGLFLAYAIETSKSSLLRRLVATANGVLANFGGINLSFIFIALISSSGLLTGWLAAVHLNPWNHGFNLYSFWGVALVYIYFQIPLFVLVITPALGGLKPAWREAASNLGASSFEYWRTVGFPVLLPSVLGGMLLLFGSALSAYATADTLTAGTVTLVPIQIGEVLNGNVFAGETNIGYALGFGMLVILSVTMLLYVLVQRRASRWLR